MAKKSKSEQEFATPHDGRSTDETLSAPDALSTQNAETSTSRPDYVADILDEVTESDEEIDAGATRAADELPADYPASQLVEVNPNATVVLPHEGSMPSESSPNAPASSASMPAASTSGASDSQATPTRRYPTLAGAFNRPPLTEEPPDLEARAPQTQELHIYDLDLEQPTEPTLQYPVYAVEAVNLDEPDSVADEVDPDVEWSISDQPTIQLSPEELVALRPSFFESDGQPDQPSAFLNTGELESQPSWPPRPYAAPSTSDPRAQGYVPRGFPPRPTPPQIQKAVLPRPQTPHSQSPRSQPPFPLPDSTRPAPHTDRLERPDGLPVHRPEVNGFPSSDDSARTARLKQLRRERVAHDRGEAATDDVTPVAQQVRQWWSDLRGNVGDALEHQHELRESGTHPLPAYTPTPTRRLGDAFGRLAASARGISERAQHAVGPAFKAIHDRVETTAQGIRDKLEGDNMRQQAPLLGPGRIAIFFRHGVSVGQAQRLLAASSARPMRLIPRKHGILAQVMPGLEPEIGERLRQHPYVDDVLYMQYLDHGQA
jgi:hypothetical protein